MPRERSSEQLKKTGIYVDATSVAKLLDTQLALVAADEGIAIIPCFGLAACRHRQVVMSPLVDPS